MVTYIIRRLFAGILTIWAATVIPFIAIQLPPSDFVDSYIANLVSTGTVLSTEEAQDLRIQYGLDRPMYVQYYKWMRLMLKGNFGMAMEYNRPVREVIGDRMSLTVVVSLAAVIFIWIMPIGIYSAVRQYSIGDYIFYLYWLYWDCHSQLYVGISCAVRQLQISQCREDWRTLFAWYEFRALEFGRRSGICSSICLYQP